MKKWTSALAGLAALASLALAAGCAKNEKPLEGHSFNNEYAHTSEMTLNALAKDLSLDIFVKLDAYPSNNKWASILSKSTNDKQCTFNLRLKSAKEAQFYYGDGSNPLVLNWNPSKTLPLGQWVRLTAVRNMKAKSLTLYANGKQVATKKFKEMAPAKETKSHIFMAGTSKTSLPITIGETRIWNKALNEKAIEASYTIDPQAADGLYACWDMAKAEKGKVADISKGNKALTIKKAQADNTKADANDKKTPAAEKKAQPAANKAPANNAKSN